MKKKIAWWVFAAALVVFLIDWGVMGIRIFTNDYDIIPLAYLGAVCLPLIFGSLVVIRWSGLSCPHCGKTSLSSGAYCPHCGKKRET